MISEIFTKLVTIGNEITEIEQLLIGKGITI